MDQPSIHFFGYIIHEPTTSLTNLILSLFFMAYSMALYNSGAKNMAAFFSFLTLSTFFAALGHGLYVDKNNLLQFISRTFNIAGIFIFSLYSISRLQKPSVRFGLKMLVLAQFVAALILILTFNRFWVVKWDALIGLGGMCLAIHLALVRNATDGNAYIIYGLLINACSAFIFSQKISINKWFNHNDISHVILLIGFSFVAFGAQKIQDYVIA